jgi:hypothetical protein
MKFWSMIHIGSCNYDVVKKPTIDVKFSSSDLANGNCYFS